MVKVNTILTKDVSVFGGAKKDLPRERNEQKEVFPQLERLRVVVGDREKRLIQYMEEISQYPLLSREEEQELAKKAAAGDVEAANLLVRSNLRFVVWVAIRYRYKTTRSPSIDLLDLIQEGNLGLIRAIQDFDWERGNKLISYAVWWIRQHINSFVDDISGPIRLPQSARRDLLALSSMKQKLHKKLGRHPTLEEIAEEMEWPLGRVKIREKLLQRQYVSLSAPVSSTDERGSTFEDVISDTQIPAPDVFTEEDVLLDEMHRRIHLLLSNRESLIILSYFGLGEDKSRQNLEKISETLGLSRERVRQIKVQALQKLYSDPTIRALLGQPSVLETENDREEKTPQPNSKARKMILHKVDRVIGVVSKEMGVQAKSVRGRSRKPIVVYARQLVMYVLHEYENLSYAAISRSLKREYSAVMQAHQEISHAARRDKSIQDELNRIRRVLKVSDTRPEVKGSGDSVGKCKPKQERKMGQQRRQPSPEKVLEGVRFVLANIVAEDPPMSEKDHAYDLGTLSYLYQRLENDTGFKRNLLRTALQTLHRAREIEYEDGPSARNPYQHIFLFYKELQEEKFGSNNKEEVEAEEVSQQEDKPLEEALNMLETLRMQVTSKDIDEGLASVHERREKLQEELEVLGKREHHLLTLRKLLEHAFPYG